MPTVRMSGRDAFLRLLEDEGVTHVFGNPGTTELALMEAMLDAQGLKYVLGLQEAVVVAMADGFARASGRLVACNLHCAPGLGHAMGALYNARFSGSPLIITAGQYELGYGLMEPMLYEPLVPIAQPLVKWAYELQRVEDLPRVVRRAAKVALTPPRGPVFLSLPGSILDDEAELEMGYSTRLHTDGPPAAASIELLVEALLQARAPVVIAGRELAEQSAMDEAGQLAIQLGAPVFHEPVPYNTRFPVTHPAFAGDLTRNQSRVRQILERHDLLLVLGGDLLRMSVRGETEPLPPGLKVIHISEREWELGKNYPTHIAIRASVRETLRAVLPRVAAGQDAAQREAAASRIRALQEVNWTAQRSRLVAQLKSAAPTQPIDPRRLAYEIAEAIPAGTIVVEEAPTTAPHLAAFLEVTEPRDFFGLASGGLGFGLGGAVGAALARPGTPVVGVIGDGSAMYAIQALWTAAHFDLPVTIVIANNGAYRIIKERLVSMRKRDHFLGMDLAAPSLNFVALAKGMGVDALRIESPDALAGALRKTIASRRPFLLDVVIDAGVQRVQA